MITARESTARESIDVFTALLDERTDLQEQLARHAQQILPGPAGLLAETRSYALSNSGKLLRPLLLLEACRAAGGDPDIVFPAAAGTESGHVASLIHDDIIDGDRERRGRETLHVKYDLAAAILTGDLLIFETFLSYTYCHDRGASAETVLSAIRTLSSTCIDVCRGQALEAAIAGDFETTEQTYFDMIGLKTASVCRAATRIGALLSDADDSVVEALSAYGDNLGVAFQIVDDVLSYAGRPAVVGKPLKSDLRNHRVTLPLIYALQQGGPSVRARIRALFAEADGAAAHDELTRILTSTHALERARACANEHTATAKARLDLLPYSESRERLRSLADIFLARDY